MTYWQGGKVRLRALEPSDVDFFIQCERDSERARSLSSVWPPRSRAEIAGWVEERTSRGLENEALTCVIETLANDPVGTISTNLCHARTGTFGYAIDIAREHRRRGYASEAIRMILRFYFEEMRYQKVTVSVHADNEPSIRLHEGLGFRHEGRLRRMIFTGGAYLDEIWLGLTAEEFRDHFQERGENDSIHQNREGATR